MSTPSPTLLDRARPRSAPSSALPPEKLLPDSQPTYVASWIYVFGALTIAALIVIVGSGMILALKGPAWWHDTGVGHFFNRSTCGRWSCSSSRWSSTCGASTGWPPGAAGARACG